MSCRETLSRSQCWTRCDNKSGHGFGTL